MMEQIVYVLMYLLTEFLNYILGYTVIFGATLTKKKSSWIITILGIVCFHMLLLLTVGREDSSAISMISMIVIPAVLLRPIDKKNFSLYLFVVFGISVWGVSTSFILSLILGIPEYLIVQGSWLTILCQNFSIAAMIIVIVYRKYKKIENYQVNLDWKQYVIFYSVVISLFFMMAPIQNLSKINSNYVEVNIIGASASLACIVLVVVSIWQGIAVNRERQMKERNAMNEKYMELQKEYYSQLINQDEKMRRFRHDFNAHMQVMNAYCEENKNDDLREYLNHVIMNSAIHADQNYTGNKSVDAVLRSLLKDATEKQIRTDIKGRLPEKMKVAAFDLCTIVSNLFKNAIEECEKLEPISHRIVYMEIGVYNSQIYISIKNPTKENVVIKNNRMTTTKNDNRNHGIGVRNVEDAVKKYGGILELQCKDGWFTAEVNI